VLSPEEVSAILIGGYNPDSGEVVPGILWGMQSFHRWFKWAGGIITALLLPIAVESIIHLWGLR
jgi:hypothetical protein